MGVTSITTKKNTSTMRRSNSNSENINTVNQIIPEEPEQSKKKSNSRRCSTRFQTLKNWRSKNKSKAATTVTNATTLPPAPKRKLEECSDSSTFSIDESEVSESPSKKLCKSCDENKEMMAQLLDLERMHQEMQNELEKERSINSDLGERNAKLEQSLKQQKSQLESLQASVQVQKTARNLLESQINSLMKKSEVLSNDIQTLQQENQKYKQLEIDQKQIIQESNQQELQQLQLENEQLRSNQHEMQLENESLLLALNSSEANRRKLHEQAMELRGNIRVYCRIRRCFRENSLPVYELPDGQIGENQKTIILNTTENNRNNEPQRKRFKFVFDKVYDEDTDQQSVFDDVSGLIQSSLDGHNVSIFAYGQTGSGKTYTMFGKVDNDEQMKYTVKGDNLIELNSAVGIIGRSVNFLFQATNSSELKRLGFGFQFEISFLEVYNEKLVDLLSNDGSEKDLKIRHSNDNQTTVQGLTIRPVNSASQVLEHLSTAVKGRTTGETKCNMHSSRSHSVFTIHITATKRFAGTTKTKKSVLNLIDLAGSERLSQSGAQHNARLLKETQVINSSLSCLGNVINARVSNRDHVPFRDSKLTYLLQNSFRGSCKTLMLCNLSPDDNHVNESLCTLRFAKKVNSCEAISTS